MKQLLTVLATFLALSTFAQTGQGNFLLGGSTDLSFISTSQDGLDDNQTDFLIQTNAGYFFIDNLAGGLVFSYANSSLGDFSSNFLIIGPFARYYVNGAIILGSSYESWSGSSDSGGFETDTSGGFINFEAGYAAFVNEILAIEPTVGYALGSGDFDGINQFGINLALTVYLGGN